MRLHLLNVFEELLLLELEVRDALRRALEALPQRLHLDRYDLDLLLALAMPNNTHNINSSRTRPLVHESRSRVVQREALYVCPLTYFGDLLEQERRVWRIGGRSRRRHGAHGGTSGLHWAGDWHHHLGALARKHRCEVCCAHGLSRHDLVNHRDREHVRQCNDWQDSVWTCSNYSGCTYHLVPAKLMRRLCMQ